MSGRDQGRPVENALESGPSGQLGQSVGAYALNPGRSGRPAFPSRRLRSSGIGDCGLFQACYKSLKSGKMGKMLDFVVWGVLI